MIRIYTANFGGARDFCGSLRVEAGVDAGKKRSAQSAAARLLLFEGLKRDFGYTDTPEFTYGKHGKPYLHSPGGEALRLWFNVSHSGDYAVCAISDEGEIGIDIQKIAPAKMKVAARIFSAEQCRSLLEKDGAERDALFCEYWVLHESTVKLYGGGVFDKVDISCAKLADGSPDGYRVAVAVAAGRKTHEK